MHRVCMEESLKKLRKNTERSNILYFQFLMKCSEICNGDSKEDTGLARKFQDSYDVTVFEGKVFLKLNETFGKIPEVAVPTPMINPQEESRKMFAFKNAIYQQANLRHQLEKKFRSIYFLYLHTGYATLEWFYPNPPIVKILEGTGLARKFQDSYDVTAFEGKVFLKPNETFGKILEVAAPKPMINPQEEFQSNF
ncbi:hypothetical protein ACSQ67_000278 [Phaseolus vulgaris]